MSSEPSSQHPTSHPLTSQSSASDAPVPTQSEFPAESVQTALQEGSAEGATMSSAAAPRPEVGRGRSPGRYSERPARAGAVALIDAEFWRWWHSIPTSTNEREVAIGARQAVRDALAQTRDGLQLQRIVWIGEQRLQGLDDLRALAVKDNETDEGWPLARALSQALFDLAAGGIVNTVLLVTDDDRLLPAVDEVQRRGLRVLMLQGQEDKLSEEWRRLLSVADRSLVLRESPVGLADRAARGPRPEGQDRTERAERTSPAMHDPRRSADRRGMPDAGPDEASEPPTDETLQTLKEAAGLWWSTLDDTARDTLRNALPQSRGLPRDLDRQLLISAARGLDRQLTVPEKHALRGSARALAAAGGRSDGGTESEGAGVQAGGESA